MSQIRKVSITLFLLLFAFFLAGCGSSNSQSNFDANAGRHQAGWLPDGHMTAAKSDLGTCTTCHGADYAGGISRVACTDCHIGNQQSIHPTQWGPFGYILHADYVKTNTNTDCANALCHGAKLDGAGSAGPSCTSCHMGGVDAMHPSWGTPDYAKHGGYVKGNGSDTSGCANSRCHGTNLDGTGGAGPSCSSCHMGGAVSAHPTYWKTFAYALHGSYVSSNNYDTSGCANAKCHGATLAGVSDSGPSCTSCHIGGAVSAHPTAWKTDITLHKGYVAANGTDSCRNTVCHGANYEGVYLSGPSCYLCH